MASPSVIQARGRLAIVAGLLVTLLVALHLMSSAVQNSAALARVFVPLLLFSLAGLASLLVLIGFNLARLVGAYRRDEPGTRLTARMVVLFVVLSLLPVGVVYGYSMQFLMRGIDSWFDVEIDTAMQRALELGRSSLDLHKRHLLHATGNLLGELQAVPDASLPVYVGQWRRAAGATELAVMDATGRTLVSSNANPGVLVPDVPDSSILQQVREGLDYVGVTPYGEDDLMHVRVVVGDAADANRVLQVLYPLTQRISELSETVQAAFTRYKELAFLRQSLKFSFSLTLLLVLLFSFFSAVWAAIFSARRLLAPISELAAATRAVADGDYSTQLAPRHTHDELGFLVRSFNAMTRRIAQARDAASESQGQVESQRAYLETLLSHLSTGVMAFQDDGTLRTANAAANQILSVDFATYAGRSLQSLAVDRPELVPLVEAVSAECSGELREWERQVTLLRADGRKVLRCGGTPLPGSREGAAGWLIVFEDITALIQAQRDAAWGEVARRLAHEIKNPLTPIQLSAERIRRRYLDKFTQEEGEVLDRATHTIVQQVEALKSMVNAFSDYARPSRLEREPVVFDRLVGEVLELYPSTGHARVEARLAAGRAIVTADAIKLRQVIHNLVKNAQEALAEHREGVICVSTRLAVGHDLSFVELLVEDDGAGFDPELAGQYFEPYVTTKARGTGLGLAIVRKIVEEHGGSIAIGDSELGGGRVTVRLPEFDVAQSGASGREQEVSKT